jgi:hypothetical protein
MAFAARESGLRGERQSLLPMGAAPLFVDAPAPCRP